MFFVLLLVSFQLTIKRLNMLHRVLFFILFFVVITPAVLLAQTINYIFDEHIKWEKVQHIQVDKNYSFDRMRFSDAFYDNQGPLPYFQKQYPIHSSDVLLKASIKVLKTGNLTASEIRLLTGMNLDTTFTVDIAKSVSREQSFAVVNVVPVRLNPVANVFEKLISFSIVVNVEDITEAGNTTHSYASNSVLSTGNWIKVRVSESGVYKITYNELSQMGFDVSVNPKNIAVFGNGGGMLPEKNDLFRYDDLVENPIKVVGEEDDKFNNGDYLLFYAQGPINWVRDKITNTFMHKNNIYDDYAYYFITSLNRQAKRITEEEPPAANTDVTVNSFIDCAVHELDEKNLASTGRLWVGEVFDFNTDKFFDFSFPNLITSEPAYFRGSFTAFSPTASYFKISDNDVLFATVSISATPGNGYNFGKMGISSKSFLAKSDNLNIKVQYQRTSNSSTGYLDYLEFNVHRRLTMNGNMMLFRNIFTNGSTAEYRLQGNSNLTIWDVTNPVDAKKVKASYEGSNYIFKTTIEPVKKFIAFNGSEFKTVEFVENVPNQNLHSTRNIDYLIVTHPDFIDQANRLAQYHAETDGITYAVVTTGEIYNEFSSGAQDISAIRDFAKKLYDESDPGKKLKYLLLFGDASFDYKNRKSDNTNFVPCWESWESLNIISSVATDDYFGCLDDGEGTGGYDKVDIGIGRFPVINVEQAQLAVDKVIHYSTKTVETFGSWRNTITFLADDEDYNGHLHDAEILTNYLETNFPVINLDKIYVDAYEQISTPSGQRAPQVNQAINNRIDKGTLIFNYSGHGGEIGFGHERFLQLADINSWKNWDKLTTFITATCEFSRYDDPARVSAGEQVFLNPKGGGVALFSTTRATYASANLALNLAIYQNNLFTKKDGEFPTFGDVIMNSKVLGGDNDRKFILIGDPAQKLAYPDFEANTLKINQHVVVDNEYDTLHALQHVTVEGSIVDANNNLVSDFNGLVYPTIYDKKSKVMTRGTDSGSQQEFFYLWQSILFSGSADISNGKFSFDFMVPKDIGYNYGKGRISYYFNSDTQDGVGYYENIIIGGFDEHASDDTDGPEIKLYMNDSLFKAGGITNENPELLAYVEDESGINTTGNGIGHDIVATIDNQTENTYILNDFYSSDINRYNSGVISYPLRNLSEGWHRLSLKVWDIFNNSSETSIDFKVVSAAQVDIESLYNFPNPFYDQTTFVFSHNQADRPVEVTLYIYAADGRPVKTIKRNYSPKGYVSSQLVWNGDSDGGEKLSKGLYICNLKVVNSDGSIATRRSKLILAR